MISCCASRGLGQVAGRHPTTRALRKENPSPWSMPASPWSVSSQATSFLKLLPTNHLFHTPVLSSVGERVEPCRSIGIDIHLLTGFPAPRLNHLILFTVGYRLRPSGL